MLIQTTTSVLSTRLLTYTGEEPHMWWLFPASGLVNIIKMVGGSVRLRQALVGEAQSGSDGLRGRASPVTARGDRVPVIPVSDDHFYWIWLGHPRSAQPVSLSDLADCRPYLVSVLGREEGYTVKHGLSQRAIPRAQALFYRISRLES